LKALPVRSTSCGGRNAGECPTLFVAFCFKFWVRAAEKETDEGTFGKELVVDIGVPETEREIEIVPLEEPVPGPAPVEDPVEDPAPA
jgi:hypothetical protein